MSYMKKPKNEITPMIMTVKFIASEATKNGKKGQEIWKIRGNFHLPEQLIINQSEVIALT